MLEYCRLLESALHGLVNSMIKGEDLILKMRVKVRVNMKVR
jgi:hypothetical protein